jgi:hypothetical protein
LNLISDKAKMGGIDKGPVRIGKASGAVGDGIDKVYRLAKKGNVDAITADCWNNREISHKISINY